MSRSHPFILLSLLLLSACAGSANHQVIAPDQPWDKTLDCQGIEKEIRRARKIIRAVERDEANFSAADLVDGALYFPFNVLIKNRNYQQAKSYAHTRVMRLQTRSSDMKCAQRAEMLPKTVTASSPFRPSSRVSAVQAGQAEATFTDRRTRPKNSKPQLAKSSPYRVIRLTD